MELAKARREFVAVADVASAWNDVLSAVRGRLLSMPTTLATIVANENEVARCQAIVETQVHEALTELSAYDPNNNAGRVDSTAQTRKNCEPADAFGRPRKRQALPHWA